MVEAQNVSSDKNPSQGKDRDESAQIPRAKQTLVSKQTTSFLVPYLAINLFFSQTYYHA